MYIHLDKSTHDLFVIFEGMFPHAVWRNPTDKHTVEFKVRDAEFTLFANGVSLQLFEKGTQEPVVSAFGRDEGRFVRDCHMRIMQTAFAPNVCPFDRAYNKASFR